jgi:WD40 repeat protein
MDEKSGRAAANEMTVKVWDMRTKSNIFTLAGHTATVADVKCQDSDPQVITASMDSTVRSVLSQAKFRFKGPADLTVSAFTVDCGIWQQEKP